MAKKKIEIKNGDRYGRLTIIEEVEPKILPSGQKMRRVKCKCDCGKTTVVDLNSLRMGRTSSCGCLQKERALEANLKTNEYEFKDNIVIGICSNGTKFYFDREDFELVKNFCWHINNRGYVAALDRSTGKAASLHRLIMRPQKGEVVDHINRNKLDNRKSNLRVCNNADNLKNTSINKNNVSGFTGVFWCTRRSKWESRIKINRKSIHLGYFTSKAEAIKARVKAELEIFSEFSANYNYFTEEQRETILNDEMPSEEIVKILNQKSIDKQYSTCYNKDK